MSDNIEVNIVGLRTFKGIKELNRLLSNLFQGFPGLTFNLISVLFNDSNQKIVCEINIQGRQTGRWNGIPSSGKIFSTDGAIYLQYDVSKKVKKIKAYVNLKSIYNQLSILKL